jgi:hypothetical protein
MIVDRGISSGSLVLSRSVLGCSFDYRKTYYFGNEKLEEGCEVMIVDKENLSIISRGFGRSVSVLSALSCS